LAQRQRGPMKQEPSIEDLRRAEAEAKRELDRIQRAFQDARLEYDLAQAHWLCANRALNAALIRAEEQKS